jgi:hypothetical protein
MRVLDGFWLETGVFLVLACWANFWLFPMKMARFQKELYFLWLFSGFFWSAKCCTFNKSFTFDFRNLSPIWTSFWVENADLDPIYQH